MHYTCCCCHCCSSSSCSAITFITFHSKTKGSVKQTNIFMDKAHYMHFYIIFTLNVKKTWKMDSTPHPFHFGLSTSKCFFNTSLSQAIEASYSSCCCCCHQMGGITSVPLRQHVMQGSVDGKNSNIISDDEWFHLLSGVSKLHGSCDDLG